MFGFGNRSTNRSVKRGGAWSGGNLRRAAVAGLGMLAYRWWRNRQASNVRPAGWSATERPPAVDGSGTGSGPVW